MTGQKEEGDSCGVGQVIFIEKYQPTLDNSGFWYYIHR